MTLSRFVGAGAAVLAVACGPASLPAPSDPSAPEVTFGDFGLDLSATDDSIRPGADFYRFANGGWIDGSEIPADRTRWGSFDILGEEAEARVKLLVESLPVGPAEDSVAAKVGEFYRAYTDTAAIESAGLGPVEPDFQRIENAHSLQDIASVMASPDMPAQAPVGFFVSVDQKNPDRYVVYLTQSGLGLPDREYYVSHDEQFTEIRSQYQEHIARMLGLAGASAADAAQQAVVLLDVETRLARLHWPIEQRRQRDLTYNPHSRGELEALAPDFPWSAYLSAAGLSDRQEFVVRETDAIAALANAFTEISVPTWQTYLLYHYLAGVASVLPERFDDERFLFYGQALNGQEQQRSRDKRAVDAVNRALGEAVGELYVERHFSPESKEEMITLVENLRRAYRQRLDALPWMSDETKRVAQEKLAAFRPKIGYPDTWRDYSKLEVRDDALGNMVRAQVFDWERQLARIDQPTDRGEWGMTPQTVNAYYNSTFNEIVFPAAILQPPFFDPLADDAVNYGAIGAVIGHEMGHGFDDQGAKSDAAGILRTWWQPEDEAAFAILVAGLSQQYDAYEALPGLHVNGDLTLGENIGDLGGLSVALEAYRISLDGEDAPMLGGLTGEQRFFLAWAQVWRSLIREGRLRTLVMSDSHSPPKLRVNGVVRNMDAWYQAFGVTPEDALYLDPDERVRIW